MMTISMAPTRTGSHAPWNSLSVLAITKLVSIRISGTISAAVAHRLHFHNFQITMKPRNPAVHTVVATAST